MPAVFAHTSGSDAHVWVGRTRLGRTRAFDSTPSNDKERGRDKMVSLTFLLLLLLLLLFIFLTGEETEPFGAAAVSRGGRDAQVPAARQHCALLRLLGGDADQAQVHRPRHRAHDVWNPQSVRLSVFFFT